MPDRLGYSLHYAGRSLPLGGDAGPTPSSLQAASRQLFDLLARFTT